MPDGSAHRSFEARGAEAARRGLHGRMGKQQKKKSGGKGGGADAGNRTQVAAPRSPKNPPKAAKPPPRPAWHAAALVVGCMSIAVGLMVAAGWGGAGARPAGPTRAALEAMKFSELMALVRKEGAMTEAQLDDVMEESDPTAALIAALLPPAATGLVALSQALGLAAGQHSPATCGVAILLTEGGDCSASQVTAQQPRCRRISGVFEQVGGRVPAEAVRFISIDAREEPGFATRLRGISSRSDLGWANASLPILFVAKVDMNVREPEAYQEALDRTFAVLFKGEEVPDAFSSSATTLSAYLEKACDAPLVGSAAEDDSHALHQQALVQAALDGDAPLVDKLLAQAPAVPLTSSDGESAGCERTWRTLCWEPLHAAYRGWRPQHGVPGRVIESLLRSGVPLDAQGASGHTVLHRTLLDWGLGATMDEFDPTPLMGWTLHQPGFDLLRKDRFEQTVLHFAARVHHFKVMREILKTARARDRQNETLDQLVSSVDVMGNSALHYATGGAIWHQDVSKGLASLNYKRRTSFDGKRATRFRQTSAHWFL